MKAKHNKQYALRDKEWAGQSAAAVQRSLLNLLIGFGKEQAFFQTRQSLPWLFLGLCLCPPSIQSLSWVFGVSCPSPIWSLPQNSPAVPSCFYGCSLGFSCACTSWKEFPCPCLPPSHPLLVRRTSRGWPESHPSCLVKCFAQLGRTMLVTPWGDCKAVFHT